MSRLGIRARVTAAFACVLALVLVAIGGFVYLRTASALNESIDNGLRARAQDVASLVRASSGRALGSGRGLIEADETLAQVLSRDGRVLDSTRELDGPVLDPAGVDRPRFSEQARVGPLEARARLLAVPAGEAVVVVGASLGDRDEALGRLAGFLALGGVAGLALASLAGYWAVGRALAPVEAMRRRAEGLSLDQRLPVPPADDELRRLGETLNAMLDRLASGVERERRFVDDASHELRTPLALHRTELELALRQAGTAEEMRAAIASSIEEVDRLSGLAEALLVVARDGDGGLELHPTDVPARELLEGVAARFRARADEAGRSVVIDAPPDVVLRGDRVLLEQALTGLVDNALRHGAGTVTLGARPGELSVRDEGPGFEPGFAERAFDRFTRADRARSSGGFGLGLAIVATIARAHGGAATAAGATVTLSRISGTPGRLCA